MICQMNQSTDSIIGNAWTKSPRAPGWAINDGDHSVSKVIRAAELWQIGKLYTTSERVEWHVRHLYSFRLPQLNRTDAANARAICVVFDCLADVPRNTRDLAPVLLHWRMMIETCRLCKSVCWDNTAAGSGDARRARRMRRAAFQPEELEFRLSSRRISAKKRPVIELGLLATISGVP